MSDCRKTVEQLAPYADGLLPVEARAQMEAHFGECPPCRLAATQEQAGRAVLKARAAHLQEIPLPPGLRTRCESVVRAHRAAPQSIWYSRLAAAITIALLVLATAAIIFGLATRRSDVLLARQLTIDHVKCFRFFADPGAGMDAAAVERSLRDDYGWRVRVPPSSSSARLSLIGARRCLYAAGSIPHMLYRADGENLSLFVLEGEGGRAADIATLGHRSRIWSEGNTTYVLVSAQANANLNRTSEYMMQQLH
jgi:anti-sigma factor RsiW